MFRLCASFASSGRGNERAALVADMGLMKVDADEREALSGRREVISAKEKESIGDAQADTEIDRRELSCASPRSWKGWGF